MIVLVDCPDDGLDTWGWVSVDATADEARAALTPSMLDHDLQYLGDPTRVWLKEPASGIEDMWMPCEPDDVGAREFWKFEALEKADRPASSRCCHPLGQSGSLAVTCALPAGHEGEHRSAFEPPLSREGQ